jgi:hypothetical protein
MSKLIYKATERYGVGWTDPRAFFDETPDALVRRILKGEVSSEGRAPMKLKVMRFDVQHANAGQMLMTSETVHDDNIYRVSVFPDGIDIVCFGLSSIDSPIDGHYDRTDDLPNWVKERLAVLMITSGTPPTQEVAGIGRRISSHVYWVYAPETTS